MNRQNPAFRHRSGGWFLFAALLALIGLSGCSQLWTSGGPETEEAKNSAPAAEELGHKVAETSWVVLLWQVPPNTPDTRVEKYHINYGDKPGNLSNHDEIRAADLAVIAHPKFGRVYQYKISDLTPHQPVYISLQAENAAGTSPPTAVIRMEPGETKPLE